ncbi:MAG: hypothetical protein H0X66_14930 [Verrucomicrobia bacterium]|nr:hypothetical protein [Verrucomicrobiota bacterium]
MRDYSLIVYSAWWYNLAILGVGTLGFFSVAVLALWLKSRNGGRTVFIAITCGLILFFGLMMKVAPIIGFWGFFGRDLTLIYLGGFLSGLFAMKKRDK